MKEDSQQMENNDRQRLTPPDNNNNSMEQTANESIQKRSTTKNAKNKKPTSISEERIDDGNKKGDRITNKNVGGTNVNRQRNKQDIRKTGNFPDISWRAISMEDLRCHPYYKPLPKPCTIVNLQRLEDVRKFRQGSWQWDALHNGRCTTSMAVVSLGFLESKAAKILGIPFNFQRPPLEAYHRLKEPALRSLDAMNFSLCDSQTPNDEQDADETAANEGNSGKQQRVIWQIDRSRRYPFVARHKSKITQNQIKSKTIVAKKKEIDTHVS